MSENDTLARIVIKILCNLENQEATISKLVTSMTALARKTYDSDGLIKCLQLFPHRFEIETKGRLETKVLLRLNVKLCSGRCQDEAGCDGLHVCTTFLLSGLCFHKSTPNCSKVHEIHTAHNLNILRPHLMDKLSKDEVRSVFRHPRNRTRTMLPPVCSLYMEDTGCSNETCRKLHICERFLLNICNDSCLKNHRQIDSQAKVILKMYGISTEKSTEDIFRDLVSMNQFAQIRYPPPRLQPVTREDQTKSKHKQGINKQTDHLSFATSSDMKTSFPNSADAPRMQSDHNIHMNVKDDIVRKTINILCQTLPMDRNDKEKIYDARNKGLAVRVFPKSTTESGTEEAEVGVVKGTAQYQRVETSGTRRGQLNDSIRRDSRSHHNEMNASSMSLFSPQTQILRNFPPPRNQMPENQQNILYRHNEHQPGQMKQFPNPPPQQFQAPRTQKLVGRRAGDNKKEMKHLEEESVMTQGQGSQMRGNTKIKITNKQSIPPLMSVVIPQTQMLGNTKAPMNQIPGNQQSISYQHHGQQPGQMPQFPKPPPRQGQYKQGRSGPTCYHQAPLQPNQWNPVQLWSQNSANPGQQQGHQCNSRQPQHSRQNYCYPGQSQLLQQPQPNYQACRPEIQQGQTVLSPGQSYVGVSPYQQKRQQNWKNPQRQQDQRQRASWQQPHKTGPKQVEKKSEEICMFNFTKCPRGDKCKYHHKKDIYQWQYKVKAIEEQEDENQPWLDFDSDSNTELETTYSDPKEDACFVAFRKGEIVTINYDEMTGSSKRTKIVIRRLSTPSSEAPIVRRVNYKWSTLWKWFWQDEPGTWFEYGEKDKQGLTACKNSKDIEQMFLVNPKRTIEFDTTANKYKLDPDNMVQINTTTSVERRVRRRPKFFSKDELMKRWMTNFIQSNESITSPAGWSIRQTKNQEELARHYAEIKVDETSEEYKKIATLFHDTLPKDRKISSVERIENGELWLSFELERLKMKIKKAGGTGTVAERSLFHGTAQNKIEAICRQGFDFRFSGFRVGAIHGKGSYFAKEAKYSDNYAEKTEQTKQMFLVRVLVGEFTKGDQSYVRPPPKSIENPHDLYDSCVDNVSDPKIFVVFTVDQAYPEYIITYT